jgi:hypothetical protein
MDPARFTRIDETTWQIEPTGAMRVPGVIYADEDLIRAMDDRSTSRPPTRHARACEGGFHARRALGYGSPSAAWLRSTRKRAVSFPLAASASTSPAA